MILFANNLNAGQFCISVGQICITSTNITYATTGDKTYSYATSMTVTQTCRSDISMCFQMPEMPVHYNFNSSQPGAPNFDFNNLKNLQEYNQKINEISQNFHQNYLNQSQQIQGTLNQKLSDFSSGNIASEIRGTQLADWGLESAPVKELLSETELLALIQKYAPSFRLDSSANVERFNSHIEYLMGQEWSHFNKYTENQKALTSSLIRQSSSLLKDPKVIQPAKTIQMQEIPAGEILTESGLDKVIEKARGGSASFSGKHKNTFAKNYLLNGSNFKSTVQNQAIQDNLNKVYQKLYNASPNTPQQIESQKIGLKAIELSDRFYGQNDYEMGRAFYGVGVIMADITLGLIPVVGVAKDLFESLTGRSILTGESLSNEARLIAGVGVLTLGVFGIVKAGAKFVKVADELGHSLPAVLNKSLSSVVVRTAEEANQNFKRFNYADVYKPGTRVYDFTAHMPIKNKFSRVFVQKPGKSLEDSAIGRFLVETSVIQNKTRQEVAEILALKGIPTHIAEVSIPAGKQLRKGQIANVMLGRDKKINAYQYEVLEMLPSQNFKNIRPLR